MFKKAATNLLTRSIYLTALIFTTCVQATIAPSVAQLSGSIEQGGLVIGKTNVANIVKLNDKRLPLSKEGDFVFGFSRDDKHQYNLTITDQDGMISSQLFKPKQRHYKIQRIKGISKKIMHPDPKALRRIKQDNTQIANGRKTNSLLNAFAHGFIAPSKGTITGVYGSQRVFNGQAKRPHFGLDFAGKTGEAVYSPADGVVTLFVADMFYSGGTLLIDHGHGINSTFLHLSKAHVKVGDKVKQGQLIAEIGASGRATGPHLDWRVNWFNVRIDPALALKIIPITHKFGH